MIKRIRLTLASLVFVAAISGCGSGPSRQLQSITISPQSVTLQSGQQAQFIATGQFNTSPMTVTPLPVSFLVRGPGFDIPGPGYSLSAQPASLFCLDSGSTLVVVAFAPTDPNAAPSGPMSIQLYDDLVVNHTTTSEGGFVAATAQITCV